MQTIKSKKVKALLCSIAIILIISVLATTLLACKDTPVGETPDGVFFVGDLQSNLTQEELAKITKEGETIYSVNDMLTATGWSLDNSKNTKDIVAGIYALAVTNYSNLTQNVYMLMTDASVDVKGSMVGDISVGVRSTYSDWIGKNGKFSQTISGVTRIDGKAVGAIDKLKSNFGYNIQSFSNDDFYAFRRASNGGATFLGESDPNVYKYIMGAKQPKWPTKYRNKGNDVNSFYIQKTTEETPEEGEPLPERANAWDPLNRIQTGVVKITNSKDYYMGNFGAGFAVYDFSRTEYLDDATTVSYDAENDIYTLNVVVKSEFADTACEFAKGALVNDTKAYIGLRDAVYTECTNVIEVYGSGLIKSIQKIETIASEKECKVMDGLLGTCKSGSTTNRAIVAFSYSDTDTDAVRLAALYFPELSNTEFFSKAGVDTSFALDFTGYDKFADYNPVVNKALLSKFVNIHKTETSGDKK